MVLATTDLESKEKTVNFIEIQETINKIKYSCPILGRTPEKLLIMF